VAAHDRGLVAGQGAGLVEDRQRDGELADVVQQGAEAELVQAAFGALDVAATAVVLPAGAREQLAAEQDAERADVDAVLMGVGVGRRQVAEDDRGPGMRGDAGAMRSTTALRACAASRGSGWRSASALRASVSAPETFCATSWRTCGGRRSTGSTPSERSSSTQIAGTPTSTSAAA